MHASIQISINPSIHLLCPSIIHMHTHLYCSTLNKAHTHPSFFPSIHPSIQRQTSRAQTYIHTHTNTNTIVHTRADLHSHSNKYKHKCPHATGSLRQHEHTLLLAVRSTSQQHARLSQGRICTDKCRRYHTEIDATDQTCYLTQSQYTETGPASPSANPSAWQGSHWSAFRFLRH